MHAKQLGFSALHLIIISLIIALHPKTSAINSYQ